MIAAIFTALPLSAWAYVKWCVNYTADMAPEPLSMIASSASFQVLLFFALFVALLLLASLSYTTYSPPPH